LPTANHTDPGVSPQARDRARGALLGLALGDALGTTLEFSRRDQAPPLEDLVGGGPFKLAPGQWTDDTSMALCLAKSLLVDWDPADQARRYVRWWRDGENSVLGYCFDIGNATRSALTRFERTGDPFSGSEAEASAGNGSLMRLAPVPIRYAWSPAMLEERAAQSSRVTHGAPDCIDACRLAARLMAAGLRGESKEQLLAIRASDATPAVGAIAAGSFRDKSRDQIQSSGWVIHSLEAALWCLHRTGDWRSGALLAANLGGDADTTAAIYGQIAGSVYGESGLPGDWLGKLAWRDRITSLADRLIEAAAQSE